LTEFPTKSSTEGIMRLATLKSGGRDGTLIVVNRDHTRAVRAAGVIGSLREALENWKSAKPALETLSKELEAGRCADAFPLNFDECHSALPRSFQWADGSAFLHHVKLVRQARGANMPENLYRVPLMYQGGSDSFLAPREGIPQLHDSHGTDFEAEVAVIVDDVPMGASPEQALKHVQLLVLVNDVSLRGLIPDELANGFGFFQSKPSSALSPLALTPEELGDQWSGGRVHLPLRVNFNGQFFGRAKGSEMHFHYGDLIAHAARTRDLAAGTIIGSGTFSNEDPSAGSSCLVEKRMLEKIHTGEFKTPFMKPGDTVEIWMEDPNGRDLFGRIRQTVYLKSGE
jgi:fumarylacetoacetate (FAA) hydrolase